MARKSPMSKNRSEYLDILKEQHENHSQPRAYDCPHHNKRYYLRTATFSDEERWGNERRYPTMAKQLAARIAILLVDENGDQLLAESDVPELMQMRGFVKHALDMLIFLNEVDPDDYSEEKLNIEKKESLETPSIVSS
jgi:hypothetical protein